MPLGYRPLETGAGSGERMRERGTDARSGSGLWMAACESYEIEKRLISLNLTYWARRRMGLPMADPESEALLTSGLHVLPSGRFKPL